MRITRHMSFALRNIQLGEAVQAGVETLGRCVSAGLLTYNGHGDTDDAASYALTPAGAAEATAWGAKVAEGRRRRAASERARATAMRSVGMRRSRYGGGWE